MDEAVLKRNLLAYLAVSLVSYFVFVSIPGAGISVSIFVLIQGVGLWFMLPKKKYLLALLPIVIFSLNSALYHNTMWRFSNFLVAGICYSVMVVWATRGISFKDKSSVTFLRVFDALFAAIPAFQWPFVWAGEAKKESMRTLRRILVGVVFSVPVLGVIALLLSSADRIFAELMGEFWVGLINIINFSTVWRLILSCVVALFLFGIMYNTLVPKKPIKEFTTSETKGDTLILNIVLASVLVIYTVFVFIQFRYLFAAPDMLPYGLNFATYARRGFFELLFLSFLNIGFILLAVWLTKAQAGAGANVTKGFASYLCVVTVVLLISSFYRMWLYSAEFGLTRLRLLVFGFLIFEAVGLVVTLFYIWKPKFSIVMVYCLIAITYYMFINLTPIDRIVARNQVDRYFAGNQTGVSYVLSLSDDALPEVRRLWLSSNGRTVADVHHRFAGRTAETGWRQRRILD